MLPWHRLLAFSFKFCLIESSSSLRGLISSWGGSGTTFSQKFQSEFSSVMGKTRGGYYAVARGRSVGTYGSWDECKSQVDGFPNARFKKFGSREEAEQFIAENSSFGGTSSKAPLPERAKSSGPSTSSTFSFSKGPQEKFDRKYSGAYKYTKPAPSSTILLPQALPRPTASSATIPSNPSQARNFSTTQVLDKRKLKVTEDRVINKRRKTDNAVPNAGVKMGNFNVDDDGYVVVFTDGACTKNGRRGARAGIGVWFGDDHNLNVSEPVFGRQTNNTAEIQAAIKAISVAKSKGVNKLNLKTDSQFTINCTTKWMNKWKRNGWKLADGKPVINKEDLEKLDAAMGGMEIKWSYVAGHRGHHGNEMADRLAVAGAERSEG